MTEYDQYDIEEVYAALRDAGLEKKDLDIIEAAIEHLQNSELILGSVQSDLPQLDEDRSTGTARQIGDTLGKIRRAIDAAYPPANRKDNQEAGIATEAPEDG